MKTTLRTLFILFLFTVKSSHESKAQVRGQFAPKKIQLKVFYPQSLPDDSLILDVTSQPGQVLLDHNRLNWKHIKSSRDKKGFFNFELEGSKSHSPGGGYICVFLAKLERMEDRANLNTISKNGDANVEMLPCYFLKNGDDVTMNVRELGKVDQKRGYRHNFGYHFSGNGALFQNLWYDIDSIAYHVTPGGFVDEKNRFDKSNYENNLAVSLEGWLKQYKNQLQLTDYEKLLCHGIFNALSDESLLIRLFLKPQFLAYDAAVRNQFKAAYDSSFNEFAKKVPSSILEDSPEYLKSKINQASFDASLLNPKTYEDSLYKSIKNGSNGKIREILLAYYFTNFQFRVTDLNNQADDALTFVKEPFYRQYILDIQRLTPGNAAYNFNLSDADGHKIHLSDFKGKVILMDFWYTGCGSCVEYFQNDLSKAEKQFATDSNVVFITVSIDKLKPFWLKSVQSGKYTSSQAINLFTDGQGSQSDIIKYYHVISFPRPILIGKDQKLKICNETLRYGDVLEKAITEEEKD